MKQQFIVTNPILQENSLNYASYTYYKRTDRNVVNAHFTGIPMIKHNVNPNADISILVIITQAGNYENNYNLFLKELNKLSDEVGIDLASKVTKYVIPFSENEDKHASFFNEICTRFIAGADLYMDVTFGSKVTSIDLFCTLVYADKVKHCEIKEVVYGKGISGENAELYDITSLYRMTQLINTMSYIPGADIDQMLAKFKSE